METPKPRDQLNWRMEAIPMMIVAPINYDGYTTKNYNVRYGRSTGLWTAWFEDSLIRQGSLQECLATCEAGIRTESVEEEEEK